MVRSFLCVAGTLAASALMCPLPSFAQSSTAYDLLPGNTQAVVWIRDSKDMVDHWEKTQLHALLSDEAIAPFFNEQRQEIEQRLMDAGWRLNIKPEDVAQYAEGQIALAWASKKDQPLKPYAIAMLADIAKDRATQSKMLQGIDKHLAEIKAQKSSLKYQGTSITKYSLPPKAGELIAQESYMTILDGLLMATDDQQLIKDLIDRTQGRNTDGVLSSEEVFNTGRQLAKTSGSAHVEYFVRPLGFARVLRSIGGKRSKSSTDMLDILENQGFAAIRCVCGEVTLGQTDFDLQHSGYVYADKPLPKSAGILDFVNSATREIPNFVGSEISSYLATNWNSQKAFWRSEGLVDEIAGTQGVFNEVIESIKQDATGPQIDIREDVLPLLTNDIYSITDNKQGETEVDSRRNMIALKVTDGAAMQDVINRAMEGEPEAEKQEFRGIEIWQVVHSDEDVITDDDVFGSGDFEDFGSDDEDFADAAEQDHWLSSFAIAVHGDYLMFASHVGMIEEAIVQASNNKVSPLVQAQDYRRVTAAIEQFAGKQDASIWQIQRTDRAYRVQYELFRKGELRRSESMLASILDRLIEADAETQDKDQKIKGEGLPAFEQIRKYLQPSGMLTRTTDQGWEFGSVLLSPGFTAPRSISAAPASGTARVGTNGSSAQR